MTLRWRKQPSSKGLGRIGELPAGSELRQGQKVLAWTAATRDHRWYWVVPSESVGEFKNTCHDPVDDEKQAKAQALAWLQPRLAKTK